jgi:hypothetical protein
MKETPALRSLQLRSYILNLSRRTYKPLLQRLASKIGKSNELGVIPSRDLFLKFQLGPNPNDFFDSENQNLQDATDNLEDNFNHFEVNPPDLNGLTLILNNNAGGVPDDFTYQNTPTEMFWFIHVILFLLKEFMISLR